MDNCSARRSSRLKFVPDVDIYIIRKSGVRIDCFLQVVELLVSRELEHLHDCVSYLENNRRQGI